MINAIIVSTFQETERKACEIIEQDMGKIERVDFGSFPKMIYYKDGTVKAVMSDSTYKTWCRGRTYYLCGVKFHSDYPCVNESEVKDDNCS